MNKSGVNITLSILEPLDELTLSGKVNLLIGSFEFIRWLLTTYEVTVAVEAECAEWFRLPWGQKGLSMAVSSSPCPKNSLSLFFNSAHPLRMLVFSRQKKFGLLFESRGTLLIYFRRWPGHGHISILVVSHWGIKLKWSSQLSPSKEVILGWLKSSCDSGHWRFTLPIAERSWGILRCDDVSLFSHRCYFS